MISVQSTGNWLKSHSHHIIFAVTLLSLSALVSWWSIFIRQAIIQQYNQKYAQIKSDLRWQTMMLGHNQDYQPREGPIPGTHLEISRTSRFEPPYSLELTPYFSHWYIQPEQGFVDEIEADLASKKKMVFGESAFLLITIIVSSLMLYRLIAVERRTASELKAFWNRVTHEIKTPITGLKAFLQSLQSQALPPEKIPAYIDLALAQVERQEQLAENLLVGQRLERSRTAFNPTDIAIESFLKDYFREHALLLKNSRVTIRAENAGTVHCDPDALRVILNNLTENAVKFTGDGLELTVTVNRKAHETVITVTDNGPGFNPEHARKIFDAYHRLTKDLPGHSHGTGMGLHVSRRLARKMGGDLVGMSEGPGSGARFILTLQAGKEIVIAQNHRR